MIAEGSGTSDFTDQQSSKAVHLIVVLQKPIVFLFIVRIGSESDESVGLAD